MENKKSKNYAVLAVLVIVLVIIAMFGVYGYFILGKGAPKIEVAPSSYDFGDILYEKVEHTFLIKNTGTKLLEIKGVSTSCGCTKAAVESEKIMPSETTNLLVTFDPNIMGDNEVGKILRIIYVKSNDPEQPEVEIKITANVIKIKDF